MTAKQQPQPVALGQAANAAFVAVVAAAYVSLLVEVGRIEAVTLAALVVLGVALTLVGLAGDLVCTRFAGRFGLPIYFGSGLLL